MDVRLILAAFRRMVSELGSSAVTIDLGTTPRRIHIEGTSDQVKRCQMILDGISSRTKSLDAGQEDADLCCVCWCDITEEACTTPCGHLYDKACFASQCSSASDFPIRCLGDGGKCQSIVPFTELKGALMQFQMENLLFNSFTDHIRTRPTEFQYCE